MKEIARRCAVVACAAIVGAMSSGCMTVSENGLYKQLRGFDFSRKQANCLVASLERDLSADELKRLARTAEWLPNESEGSEVIYGLMRGADKRVKGALADAGNQCLMEKP